MESHAYRFRSPRLTGCFRLMTASLLLALSLAPAFALPVSPSPLGSPPLPAPAQGSVDLFRIRVENRAGGEIAVSADNGHSFSVVGHVLTPAKVLVSGFSATVWAKDGTVCATAVHGIRICVGHNAAGRGKLFSIIPYEYRNLPDSFGGQRSGAAGIYTDIAAGTSIFRNLSPLVGNGVFIEKHGVLDNIKTNYQPHVGDVIVIDVARPAEYPNEIDFANKKGGLVEEVFPGGDKVTVAQVLQPVEGIGRYDATSYTGVGRINTNHPGVITVSTAPMAGVDISDEERSWERRGGFQIIPSVHAREFKSPPLAMMVVGPPPGSNRPLEGTPPLFSGVIGLTNVSGDPSESFRVQVRVDHGPWERMPGFTGIDPLLFTARPLQKYFESEGIHRTIKDGITDIRILFPHTDSSFAASQLQAAVMQASRSRINLSAADDHDAIVRGRVEVNVNLRGDNPRLKFVVFLVDGRTRAFSDTSSRPFQFTWDTQDDTNGRHIVSVEGEDMNGNVLSRTTSRVIVANAGAKSPEVH